MLCKSPHSTKPNQLLQGSFRYALGRPCSLYCGTKGSVTSIATSVPPPSAGDLLHRMCIPDVVKVCPLTIGKQIHAAAAAAAIERCELALCAWQERQATPGQRHLMQSHVRHERVTAEGLQAEKGPSVPAKSKLFVVVNQQSRQP